MAKQKHDLGVRKRQTSKPPLRRDRLRWLRVKRSHPGPLPYVLRDFKAWLEAGKPRRWR